MTDQDDEVQEKEWEALYERITQALARFGKEDQFGEGDYLVVGDNYGWHRHKIEVQNLAMLRPDIVASLRSELAEFPDWEITLAVDVPGTESTWPRMGLTVRAKEIIDGLQRAWLPDEIKAFQYEGSRPGTGYD